MKWTMKTTITTMKKMIPTPTGPTPTLKVIGILTTTTTTTKSLVLMPNHLLGALLFWLPPLTQPRQQSRLISPLHHLHLPFHLRTQRLRERWSCPKKVLILFLARNKSTLTTRGANLLVEAVSKSIHFIIVPPPRHCRQLQILHPTFRNEPTATTTTL